MKKGISNVLFSVLAQVVTIIVGFLLPKYIIMEYGSEMNGLLSSTNQILVYLGLFEAGVGNATIQALYKPIVEDDKKGINAILSATCTFYNRAGVYYIFAVVIVALIYAFSVPSGIPWLTIAGIILASGLGSVLNYWGFGKYKAFLQAEGRGYVANNLATIAYVFSNIGKIILVTYGYPLVLVQCMQLVYYIIQTIGILIYIRTRYDWIDTKVTPDLKAISQKNAVLLHQISSLIFSNTDVLILTMFCGFAVVSMYNMYNQIYSIVMNLITTMVGSIIYVFGKIYCENPNNYGKYHDLFESAYIGLGMAVFSAIYVATIPFVKLYTRGFSDMDYINYVVPILFLIIQFLNIARGASNNLINIVGDFEETKNRAVLEMAINIVVSIICVNKFGIYGVLFGTIVALFYRTNDMLIYANRIILKRSILKSYVKVSFNLLMTIIIIWFNNRYICFVPQNYFELAVFSVCTGMCTLLIYGTVNGVMEFKGLRECIQTRIRNAVR